MQCCTTGCLRAADVTDLQTGNRARSSPGPLFSFLSFRAQKEYLQSAKGAQRAGAGLLQQQDPEPIKIRTLNTVSLCWLKP